MSITGGNSNMVPEMETNRYVEQPILVLLATLQRVQNVGDASTYQSISSSLNECTPHSTPLLDH